MIEADVLGLAPVRELFAEFRSTVGSDLFWEPDFKEPGVDIMDDFFCAESFTFKVLLIG